MKTASLGIGHVLLFAAAALSCACSGAAEDSMGGAGGGSGTTSTMPPMPGEVRFDEPGTLTLKPGQEVMLGVSAKPAAPFGIAFALLGSPLDAWLDPPEVLADAATGHASVTLHAPSQATTFHVRAALLDEHGAPGASADRAVAVSDQGFASVRVVPAYAGLRPVTEWVANVVALADCADLAPMLPEDPPGALVASAAAGAPLVVENAPVGPDLAVIVRAGHYAWGCANTTALTPGETLEVSVTVIDEPLDLSNVSLSATFDYQADLATVAPLLANAAAQVVQAFAPPGGKVGLMVLNGMAVLNTGANAAAFAAQRIDKGWDNLATQHFAGQSPSLVQWLELWTAAGVLLQTPAFEAQITSGAAADPPAIDITGFGDVDPASAGIAPGSVLTWSTEAGDKVLLGTELIWEPSRFAGAAALVSAKQDLPGIASVGEALALVADCHGLAASLGPFGSCDLVCVEHLCAEALAARFTSALSASAASGQLGKITVKASADAQVGDRAEPVALTGKWIGTITDGTFGGMVMGNLSATAE